MPLKKQTVDYIAAIEHLDTPLTVVGFKGWLFLLFAILLTFSVLIWAFVGTITVTVHGKSILFDSSNVHAVNINTGGVIKEIKVQTGETVKKDQVLMTLKKQTQEEENIIAPSDGIISVIKVTPGEQVQENIFLASIQGPADLKTLKVYGFITFPQSNAVRPGMEVKCALNKVNTSVYGMLLGKVKEVMPYPVSVSDAIMKEIPSEALRDYLIGGPHPSQLIIIEPIIDNQTVSGLAWTSREGPPMRIESGMVGTVQVTLEKVKPISYLIPSIRKK